MSDLKARPGQPLTADSWNKVIDRLPGLDGSGHLLKTRILLCRTTQSIDGATIDDTDTADSVYNAGTVDVYGLVDNGDGTFSPAMLPGERIMINASSDVIPDGTELWATETIGGTLISTVWIC